MRQEGQPYVLAPYRVLDLTDEKGWACGKYLGDLGADVLKIEPPGGDPGRRRGPFYKDTPHPEKSLFWYSYNASKRGVTLNLKSPDGRRLFQQMVETADVVLESFPPGFMEGIGLGYEDLYAIKPDIIVTSITPFGRTGPYRDYKATDLVLQGMGGFQHLNGDPDRPPIRPGQETIAPQTGAEAAFATVGALYHRGMTGEGQHIDVSMQLVAIWQLMNASGYPKLMGYNQVRHGDMTHAGLARQRALWRVKDGYAASFIYGGPAGAPFVRALVRCMDRDGMAPDFLKEYKWEEWDFARMMTDPNGQAFIDRLEEAVGRWLLTKTKAEVWELAFRERILFAPSLNAKEIFEHPQLNARGFYVSLEHPELEESVPYPGPFARFNGAAAGPRFRAPLIGEHNEEVYGQELGLSREELVLLEQVGAI